MQVNQHLKELLLSHIRGTISETDRAALFASLATEGLADEWKLIINELSSEVKLSGPYSELEWEPMIEDILNRKLQVGSDTRRRPLLRFLLNNKRWVAAAAMIGIIATGAIVLLTKNKPDQSLAKGNSPLQNDVKAPTSSRATITLANGQTVYLDSLHQGLLAQQGNIRVVKLVDGQIAYQTASGEIIRELQYNTLSNPKGSKVIDMQLADGSHVWLNAGSSVTYPIAFIGKERKVEITGEAYFEVAHNRAMPFIVSKGTVDVRVLGTHFNVNAYDDEADIEVTLLEGSVSVNKGNQNSLLKPGDQAQVRNNIKVVNAVNVDIVMAWKNGRFQFEHTPLPVVMRQLSRWYDIEVQYVKDTPNVVFAGEMGRDLNLSQVLTVLSKMEVNFKLEGKKLTVMP